MSLDILDQSAVGGWEPGLQKAKVYEQILLDVLLGALPPGGRIDEESLTRRYDAGLAGVRDALGRLALEGLVVRKPRAGTTVAPLDLMDVRQDYEVRRLLEPHAAVLAAQNASPADIRALRAAFEDAEAAVERRDVRALVVMDRKFHTALSIATRNLSLAKMIVPLQHKATRFWVYSMREDTPDELLSEVERHRQIAEHIARHDEAAARAAMEAVVGGFLMSRLVAGRSPR